MERSQGVLTPLQEFHTPRARQQADSMVSDPSAHAVRALALANPLGGRITALPSGSPCLYDQRTDCLRASSIAHRASPAHTADTPGATAGDIRGSLNPHKLPIGRGGGAGRKQKQRMGMGETCQVSRLRRSWDVNGGSPAPDARVVLTCLSQGGAGGSPGHSGAPAWRALTQPGWEGLGRLPGGWGLSQRSRGGREETSSQLECSQGPRAKIHSIGLVFRELGRGEVISQRKMRTRRWAPETV